jgi:hypothetical protein
VDDFVARLNVRSALQLYLFLEKRETELAGSPAELHIKLRSYLYDRLSIEEMESPETFLSKLDER